MEVGWKEWDRNENGIDSHWEIRMGKDEKREDGQGRKNDRGGL